MKKLLLLLLFPFFFSCQQKEKNSTTSVTTDTISAAQLKNESKAAKKQMGDTLFMNVINDKGFLAAEGSLDSIHPRMYVKFKAEALAELKAKITTPSGGGNIRFNQIIYPNHTSDGPFGRDLELKLTQKGTYVLVVGHSLMADAPYFGTFEIELANIPDS